MQFPLVYVYSPHLFTGHSSRFSSSLVPRASHVSYPNIASRSVSSSLIISITPRIPANRDAASTGRAVVPVPTSRHKSRDQRLFGHSDTSDYIRRRPSGYCWVPEGSSGHGWPRAKRSPKLKGPWGQSGVFKKK